jgi:mitogen-activated protein kinase 1/3
MAQQTTRHKVRLKNIEFSVPTRYSSLSYLGGGSYGLVASAKDAQRANKDNGMVAIKRIGGVFRDIIDAKRILREMKLLRHLRGHANVVGIHNIFSGPTNSNGLSKVKFNDIYLVTPLFQSDLFKIIQSDQKLSPAHARYFVYQLLRGLKYIHSANIIHRDLKPANLLINSDCQLAICDFGLARGIPNLNDSFRQVSTHKNQNSTVQLTHYVVTRWYRAPELLVENNEYGKAIDMWSVGCILGEILGRR